MKIITIKYSNCNKHYSYLLRSDSIRFRDSDVLKVPRGTDRVYYTPAYVIAVQEIVELSPRVTAWLQVKKGSVITTGSLDSILRRKVENKLLKFKKEHSEDYKNILVKRLNTITFTIEELMKLWDKTPKQNTDKLESICIKIASLEDERDEICKKLNIVWKY